MRGGIRNMRGGHSEHARGAFGTCTLQKNSYKMLIYIAIFFNRVALNLFKSFSNPRARKTPVDNSAAMQQNGG